MPGFKYFIPGKTPAELASGGRLLHAALPAAIARPLADVEVEGRDCALSAVHANGPGGTAGVVLTVFGAEEGADRVSLQYRPQAQGWIAAADGAVWIGWERAALPTPADLERRTRAPGYDVRDGAEQVWQIPIARTPTELYGTLPRAYTFNGQNRPVPHLKASWRELWERAGNLWIYYAWQFGAEAIASGQCQPPPQEVPAEWQGIGWLLEQTVWILGVNYRIGPLEINALYEAERPILDDRFKHAVCQAVCDFDFTLELLKKKPENPFDPANAGSSSPPGDRDDSPATDPASPDCGSLTS